MKEYTKRLSSKGEKKKITARLQSWTLKGKCDSAELRSCKEGSPAKEPVIAKTRRCASAGATGGKGSLCGWTRGWELGVAGLLQVEFPEARIFEETLNILIYETPRGPDPALLEATGGVAGGGGVARGEDEENREHRVRRIHVRRHITHDERPHGQQIVFKD